jgi:hypothetical protein
MYVYQHFLFYRHPKYTKIGIFVLKVYHLATLVSMSAMKLENLGVFFDTDDSENFFSSKFQISTSERFLDQQFYFFINPTLICGIIFGER